ncbi:MAG: amidohydrolase family protein, partial [Sphaerochaetaceae bacterium]|nr:amidohydrolase family protein [Sphaerochaetaceae bacterium]
FSTGLYYAPCLFASKDELIELLKVTKANNRLFSVHHRCEGNEVLSSLDEIINLVTPIGVKTEISHLKAIGRNNQKYVSAMVQKIHQSRDNGLDIAFDQYPYEYGSTSLFSLLPPSLLQLEQKDLLDELKNILNDKEKKDEIIKQMLHPQGWDSIAELCSWDDIMIVSLGCNPSFNGKTMSQIAKELNKTPFDTLFYILSQETKCALMADVTQSLESLETIMKDSLMAFGTDALYTGEMAHPRSGNATIHFLSEYVYKRKTLKLEEAIEKMTSKVASRLNLLNVGQIKEDFIANLVVLDPLNLKDNSSLKNPYKTCDGIVHILVNGDFALKNCVLTNSLSGRVLMA